jgi:hypothetical protein
MIYFGRERQKEVLKTYPENSCLYNAAKSGRFSELKRYIEEDKIDINSIDFQSGGTALHGALQSKLTDMALYLIEKVFISSILFIFFKGN